jgi:hypothetical protein
MVPVAPTRSAVRGRVLADRVEVLAGKLDLRSPPGRCTVLTAGIPYEG